MTMRIDVHNHVIPDKYVQLLSTIGVTETPGRPFPSWSPRKALKVMDRNDIGTAILSISTPGTWFQDAEFSRTLTRATNEYCARLVEEHPGRFGAFAALPLPDVDGALIELGYALDTLGLDGVGLFSNYGGVYLGDPRFERIFAELDRRRAVVFVHPEDCLTQEERYAHLTPLLERMLDTTRAVTRLLTSGTLSRYPRIRFILAHGGGSVPFMAERIAASMNGAQRSTLDRSLVTPTDVSEGIELLSRLYYDTAQPGEAHLETVQELAGDEHIVFGTDAGWGSAFETALTTKEVVKFDGFDSRARQRVDRDNALTLFPRFA